MTLRKYLVLLAVVIFGSSGNVCLGRGMKDFGPVNSSNWTRLLIALLNPWVLVGIGLLLLFFCSYLSALSWADLTYVLPATAIGYVLTALLANLLLHENVTFTHWLGIGLITAGVGFVATGPALTAPVESGAATKRVRAHERELVLTENARSDA
ncbi:MAG: EamA family transporter [Candidatus Korobacteraceae bacterium]